MSDRPSAAILNLKEVTLAATIGSAYLLKNISFQVNKGDRLVIIGASGAGKSSLLRLLNRLKDPTSGTIYLENQPLQQIPVIQLRQQIVLLPQEPKLLGMSVAETLAYPLILQKLPKAEIRQRLDTWRNNLRIPEKWLERNELQLSVGQRQLVAIARVLMMQPKVLLLDEPTSALDIGNANHLLSLLTQLAENSHCTIIMVNHQLELVQNFANRYVFLQEGKITEDVPATPINWQKLKDNLLQAEAKIAQEWL